MSPEEIQKAAAFLQMTTNEFAHKFASHFVETSDVYNEATSWLRLSEKENGCILLGDDGKLCSIYEARPVQCRTYPFWPTIMQTKESWDSECRRKVEDTDNPLQPWTPENGGCEGMQTMDSSSSSSTNEDNKQEGVPVREAYRQLFEYIASDRRFPKGPEQPFPS
jgi:Fe-S-cluster containining protein